MWDYDCRSGVHAIGRVQNLTHPTEWVVGQGLSGRTICQAQAFVKACSSSPHQDAAVVFCGWLGLGDCGELSTGLHSSISQLGYLQPAWVGPGVPSRLWQPLHSGFLFWVPGRGASRQHPAHVPTRLRAWPEGRLHCCGSLNTFAGLLLGEVKGARELMGHRVPCHPLWVSCSHPWLSEPWHVAGMSEDTNYYFSSFEFFFLRYSFKCIWNN